MNYLVARQAPIAASAEIIPDGTYSNGSDTWHLYLCTKDVTAEHSGSKLIGAWDFDGNPQGPIDSDYALFIRPFGNMQVVEYNSDGNPISTVDGVATPALSHNNFWGAAQRKLQNEPDTLPEYPADTQPIILKMESVWDDTPGWNGWGWRATIEFADPNRVPDARAIGIYDESWVYQYTTGAFVLTDGQWQTHNPAGRVTQSPEPIYYALLFGAAQEGKMVLTSQSQTSYFWEHDQ